MLRTNGEFLPVVRPNDKSGQGWADYRAGRPYDPAYDGWDQIDQRNYERGRLRAAGAHLVYRRVPAREPRDIIAKTNGLRLIPPAADKRRQRRRHRRA